MLETGSHCWTEADNTSNSHNLNKVFMKILMVTVMLTRCKLLLSKSESVSQSLAMLHLNLIRNIMIG